MNEAPVNPALELAEPPREDQGWSGRRMLFFIVLVFGVHLGLIYFLGTKKTNAPRVVTNIPQWQIALANDELVALNDPTLFALPHANDFATCFWNVTPTIALPDFRWTEVPRWLPLQTPDLGAAFREFMQTNRFAETPLNFKPAPIFEVSAFIAETVLPNASGLEIGGKLRGRQVLQTVNVPTLNLNDVIAPSRVQAVVEPDGNIATVVLLESSGYAEADQEAVRLARSVRFAPAPGLVIGELIFQWHTAVTETKP